MKYILTTLFLFGSLSSFASIIEIEVETQNAKSVCNNTKELTSLLSPYVDVALLECSQKLLDTGWLGTKTYSVNIQFESYVKPCRSEKNQAISFSIPTNTYPYWNPPLRFTYLDKILEKLEFKSEIGVKGIGPNNAVPSYTQIVFIPECAFKN